MPFAASVCLAQPGVLVSVVHLNVELRHEDVDYITVEKRVVSTQFGHLSFLPLLHQYH